MTDWSSLVQGLACEAVLKAPMSEHTTFKIGGPADALILVHNNEALPALLSRLHQEGVPYRFIGCGSNLLIADEGIRGAMIRLDADSADVRRLDASTLHVDAGMSLAKLSRTAQRMGLCGLEFACGIPGSVGGAVYMNAGAYGGEMVQVVRSAEVLFQNGEHAVLSLDELGLSYRRSALMDNGGMVLSVTLALSEGDPAAIHETMASLLTARREKQPLEYPSAGSFFKRPAGYFAGKLIDDCGLRGYRVGDAQVSEKHAGFVINRGNATCEQVKQLEQDVRLRVFEEFGVEMSPEVRLLGTVWLP